MADYIDQMMKGVRTLATGLAVVGTVMLGGCEREIDYKCEAAIAGLRYEFEQRCEALGNRDRDLPNAGLDELAEQRRGALTTAGCEPDYEVWVCGRPSYGDYEMRVEK